MATNLALDDDLIEKARSVSGLKTKRETVTLALEEFIRRRQMGSIAAQFGTVVYEPDYDYKAARR